MNRAFASIGIAAAVVCGSATPALAADNPIDAKITYISSGSSQVSSPVTVKGAWSTKKLEVRGGTTGDGTTPAPCPSPSETPIPSTRPTKTAETPKPSETKLAKTGFDPGILIALVPLTAAFGVVIYFASRKEDI